MTSPEYDPDLIKIRAATIEEWIKSLPEGTTLRVFHASGYTYLERIGDRNELYIVSDGRELK